MMRPSLMTHDRCLPPCKHADIGDRVCIQHDQVCEFAGRKLADLAFEPHRIGIGPGRRHDRLHRRIAAVFHEDLDLLGVQLTVAGELVVARVGADQEPDAELARLVHQLAQEIEVLLHAVDVELHLIGADLVAEFDHLGEERRGRQDRHAGLGHRFEIAVGREIGVHDPVDASLGGGTRRTRATRVDRDLQVAPMRLADHRRDLVLGDHLRVTAAAVRHLDEIDAVLVLTAHLGDHRIGRVAEDADRMLRRAFPGRLVVLDAAIGDHHAARDEHARAVHQAELDGVAHADVGEPGAARNRDTGDARAQHLLRHARRFKRGEFRPGVCPCLCLRP